MVMNNQIIEGDFRKGTLISLSLFGRVVLGNWKRLDITNMIDKVEKITSENKKDIISATGWGILGGLTFGPLGVLAGLVFGGRGKQYGIICYLKDGRKFVAVVDSELLHKIVILSNK